MKKRTGKWRRLLNLLIFAVISAVPIFILANVVMGVLFLTVPVNRPICCQTPADYQLAYEDVVLETEDGVRLAGWYIPSQNGAAVILLHGYGGNRLALLNLADMLAAHGFGILLYDLRGHGESISDFRSIGWQDVQDVSAALAYLREREDLVAGRVAVMGFSIGAQVAIQAGARATDIQAVIADGPADVRASDLPRDDLWDHFYGGVMVSLLNEGIAWRTGVPIPQGILDTIANVSPRPLLLIAGGRTPRNLEMRTVRGYYEAAGKPRELWEVPEAGHVGARSARPEAYEERVISFLTRALLNHARIP
ncbi:MAG: alpha/beta fold hydrolase [Chloroflexi bacterium]|nr:alpha/beta fold hydrolase [Chloroflexota bacterium]MCI0578063.1 alpha/beta fold hydrolase [Chloroflexota bacterium]MCI0646051.1 alpha/beta fold hydrolase [Chloroflexota bacterium]MCI0732039.1 alpha/beta fold hydrolase [Chloroflexota bacterium]